MRLENDSFFCSIPPEGKEPILPSRPAMAQAAGRSGGQGRSVSEPVGFSLDGREHGGTLSGKEAGDEIDEIYRSASG